jgi:hypothetical protein
VALRLIALILVIMLGGYGLLAIDMGRVNSAPLFGDQQKLVAERTATTVAVDAHRSDRNTASAPEHSGLWLALMSKATSPQYTYGSDSYFTTSLYHYAVMPKPNMLILSLHNVLGGICMLFGAMQFWPAFRRNYPRWHRGFGLVYMISVQVAMIMAGIYLFITPVAVIYDSFSFAVGLWALVIIVTASLWMSIYHLLRREIGQHQAYMAINFGALLTAPILRYDWTLFGALFPHLSMNTVNYLTAGILLPQSIIIGYLLLCVTRGLQVTRPANAKQTIKPIPKWQKGLVGAIVLTLLAGMLTVLDHFVLNPGLISIAQSQTMIPAGLLALDQQMIVQQVGLRILFVASTLLALLSMMGFVWLHFASRSRPALGRTTALLMAGSSALSGLILLCWGWQLGAPSSAMLAGGTHAVMYGVIILLFSLLLSVALWRRHEALIKEWGLFLLGRVMATAVFYWLMALLAVLPIPHAFVVQGHVYRLAADAGPVLLIAMLLYSVYGQATQEKFSR